AIGSASGQEAAGGVSSADFNSPTLVEQTINLRQFDIIPFSDSAEHGQNSEPSLAVNPTDPAQIIAGSFSSTFTGGGVSSPYFKTTNGGTTWSDYGSLVTQDKTMASKVDGSAALT